MPDLGTLPAFRHFASAPGLRTERSSALLSIRQLHAYLGMLIAPTVLFLAATGLLQIYNLHEAHAGYTPPALIAALSAVHKDQHFAMKDDDGHAAGAEARKHEAEHEAEHAAEHEGKGGAQTPITLLKAYFALVAVGLFLSTLAGLWMALQQSLRRRTHLVLLAIGTIVPVVLAALTG
jgi:hypothetical protein